MQNSLDYLETSAKFIFSDDVNNATYEAGSAETSESDLGELLNTARPSPVTTRLAMARAQNPFMPIQPVANSICTAQLAGNDVIKIAVPDSAKICLITCGQITNTGDCVTLVTLDANAPALVSGQAIEGGGAMVIPKDSQRVIYIEGKRSVTLKRLGDLAGVSVISLEFLF